MGILVDHADIYLRLQRDQPCYMGSWQRESPSQVALRLILTGCGDGQCERIGVWGSDGLARVTESMKAISRYLKAELDGQEDILRHSHWAGRFDCSDTQVQYKLSAFFYVLRDMSPSVPRPFQCRA